MFIIYIALPWLYSLTIKLDILGLTKWIPYNTFSSKLEFIFEDATKIVLHLSHNILEPIPQRIVELQLFVTIIIRIFVINSLWAWPQVCTFHNSHFLEMNKLYFCDLILHLLLRPKLSDSVNCVYLFKLSCAYISLAITPFFSRQDTRWLLPEPEHVRFISSNLKPSVINITIYFWQF